ncbi:metallophosphoesterase [Nakamurella deserti]|uniref:metallophosphoesterase n=1 Tax=Nakamurella deserti TaxID=2164074 RepID=UPI000DBE2E67|nr:metallophosphoesterase [Nakamurella deserti]
MGFLFGLGGLVLVVHLYLHWRLVASTGRSRRWRVTGAVVLGLLFAVLVTALATQRSGPLQQWTPLHFTGNTWLAGVLYLTLALLVGEVIRLVLLVVRRARRRPTDAARRLLLSRVVAVGAGAVATGVVGYGLTQAHGPIRVVRQTVTLPGLPPAFEGYRIALATDLHLGAISGRARTREVVDLVNAERVDVVTLVGDLSDGLPSTLVDATAPLTDLRAPDGILFTTGNHEYYSDAVAWREALPELRVEVLHNASHVVTRGDSRLFFAGINDYTGEEFGDPADLASALAQRRPDDTVVLLAHQPRQAAMAAAAGVDLQLAGHTHGGQVWPFHYAVLAQQKTLAGLSRVGDTQVFTSRGAGFWGPPVRVGAPPDVSVLTLTAG